MQNVPHRQRQGGFTLIEIMAVVLIIGLLSGLVGYAVFAQVDRASVTATRAQIQSLEGVLELYRMDNARFPTTEQGLEALIYETTVAPVPRDFPAGGYINKRRIPTDSWGEALHYESPGQNNPHAFDLWSYGADALPGGEGVNKDISNWNEDSIES